MTTHTISTIIYTRNTHTYVCMYVKIRRYQHTRVHAHTGPRRHARAPACHRHHSHSLPHGELVITNEAMDTNR